MKSILFCVSVLFTLCASAQTLHLIIDTVTNKYTYEETVKCDSTLSDTTLFYSIKDWALSQELNLNRLKDDKSTGKEVMTGLFGTKYVNFTPIDLQYKNKSAIKSEQPETKKIVLNGVYKYTSKLWSCLQTSYTNFDVIILCRKGRAKIFFKNFTIDIYTTQDAKPVPFSGITLEDFINTELPKHGQPCKERISEYTIELQNQCDKILTDFKKHVTNLKAGVKDEW